MKPHLIRLPLSVLTAAAAALLATSATPEARADHRSSRAPLTGAVDLKTGLTSVVLDPAFQANLASAGVQISRVRPGHLVKGRLTFRFPISGGAVDLNTLEAEVIHSGGLTLRTPTATVTLLDFIISLPPASPPADPGGGGLSDVSSLPPPVAAGPAAELSALVIVNGALVGRVPLFALDLTASGLTAPLVPRKHQRVSIERVALALTADGAAALNAAFGVTSFAAGAPAGTANVAGLVARDDDRSRD